MSHPITLWDHKRRTRQTTDDAGTTIFKSIIPSGLPIPGPYEAQTTETEPGVFVPSLVSLAIKKLSEYPDQIHALGHIRLRYQAPSSHRSHDVLRELIPNYEPDAPDFDLQRVDPRLWATLVQVFSDLPDTFRTYRIPLSDKHVPLLQRVPSTSHFSLVTILDLPRCRELTDDTILELKQLSSLCAFDASETSLSGYGIKSLSMTLGWKDTDDNLSREKRGPWGLRILNLRNCRNVSNDIFDCLQKFLLLSVLDLRGTKCNSRPRQTGKFKPTTSKAFFYPTPLSTSLDLLSSTSLGDIPIFSSPQIHTLHITSLSHDVRPQIRHLQGRSRPYGTSREKPSVSLEDTYVVIPSRDRAEAGTEVRQPAVAVRHPSTTRPSIRDLSSVFRGWPSLATTPPTTSSVASVAIEAILQDEARIEATERAATSFYSTASTTRAGLPRRKLPVTIPPNRMQTMRPGQDDLMLFRDPPPWVTLESMNPPEATHSSRPHAALGDLATVGWSNGKGAKGMQALADMVKMRQQHTRSGSTTVKANKPKPNNPFHRNYPPEVVTPNDHPCTTPASSSRAPLSPRLASHTPSSAHKPLRPISTLVVPVLPEDIRSGKRKGHSLVAESPKRRFVTSTQTTKEATVSRSSGNNIIKASGNRTSSKIGNTGFDWKNWGKS